MHEVTVIARLDCHSRPNRESNFCRADFRIDFRQQFDVRAGQLFFVYTRTNVINSMLDRYNRHSRRAAFSGPIWEADFDASWLCWLQVSRSFLMARRLNYMRTLT